MDDMELLRYICDTRPKEQFRRIYKAFIKNGGENIQIISKIENKE